MKRLLGETRENIRIRPQKILKYKVLNAMVRKVSQGRMGEGRSSM